MIKAVISLILMTSSAYAAMPYPGMADKCTLAANAAVMDFGGMGVDPDGAAISFDPNGTTQIARPENIVSRENKNGVETITYKTRQVKMGAVWKPGQPFEYETVQKTVTIKRENGKIVSVNKDMDIPGQIKMRKQWEKNGFKGNFPYTKSMETTFAHNGSDCEINQTLSYQMADEKAKVEGKVMYDKEFCDKLAPIVKRMGSQNASQCVGLISSAQMTFEQRNKELKKDNKSFAILDWPGKKHADPMANLDVGMFIQSCAMADMNGMGPWGMPGGLMASGGMMGMMVSGGGMMGNSPESSSAPKSSKPVKASTQQGAK
ncbi:hypothetical protein [Bdellovibrio sp. BCCA]|uniref:hypothetical protein n=1 Tax=Bdellovibrio sp. BCCA TaxID=3136281 RepID=UPI0030F13EDB